ncbi:MAG: hypothetical protein ABR582_06490 [Gemmatimonadaceae bacterium]
MSSRSEASPSGAEDNPSILNENQRRHFEVFVSMLEEAIHEVEVLAGSPSRRADGMISYDDDLPVGFAPEMLPRVESLRVQIAQLVELLDLPRRRRSRARLVRALLTAQIVRTDDSYVRKLRGYGAVDDRAAERIDPIIDAIRADLIQLRQLAEEQS